MSYAFQNEYLYREASYEAYQHGKTKQFDEMCRDYRWMYPEEEYDRYSSSSY